MVKPSLQKMYTSGLTTVFCSKVLDNPLNDPHDGMAGNGDILLSVINRAIDRKYHKHFNNPNLTHCLAAVITDTLTHIAVEKMYGLPDGEVKRRVKTYFPRGLEKCVKAGLNASKRYAKRGSPPAEHLFPLRP